MDRHQPHGVQVLGLERRLSLARGQHVLLREVVDERAQVAALLGLERARQAHQLAHVRHPPAAVGQREQRAVVARVGDDAVEQALERHGRRERAVLLDLATSSGMRSRSAGGEGVEQAVRAVRRGERPPRIAVEPPGRQAEQADRVEREPAERGAENRVERLLVERVREHRQVRAQVGHLLLRPVVAPADHVGLDPPLAQRPLVERHVDRRAQQDDDVVGGAPVVDQPPDAVREQPHLGGAPRRQVGQARAERRPRRASSQRARRLVDDDQLDGRAPSRGRAVQVELELVGRRRGCPTGSSRWKPRPSAGAKVAFRAARIRRCCGVRLEARAPRRFAPPRRALAEDARCRRAGSCRSTGIVAYGEQPPVRRREQVEQPDWSRFVSWNWSTSTCPNCAR